MLEFLLGASVAVVRGVLEGAVEVGMVRPSQQNGGDVFQYFVAGGHGSQPFAPFVRRTASIGCTLGWSFACPRDEEGAIGLGEFGPSRNLRLGGP